MKPRGTGGFAAAVMLIAATAAHAGRPFATDDAGVLEARACEWESAATRLRDDAGRATGWQTQLGCGVGARTQLSLGYGQVRGGGDRTATASVGGKLALVGGGEGAASITATAAINAMRVVGDGFVLKDHALTLVATHAIADGWTLHANLGHLHDRASRRSSTGWNLALERALGAGVDLGAEAYGDDRGSRWLAAGLRWTPTDAISLNASLGRTIGSGSGSGSAARLASVGAKLSF